MRKWLVSAVIPVLCFLLCGCGEGFLSKTVKPEDLQFTFDCPAVIQTEDQSWECYVFHNLAQKTEITVTDSGSMNGLQYRQNGTEISLLYDGMEYAAKKELFPQTCCFSQIADVLNGAQAYETLIPLGQNMFSCSVNGKAFRITADQEGRILELSTGMLTATFAPQTME